LVLFENVNLRYGDGPAILQQVSFTLAPGSFHFIVGASGAGKSSLLRMMYLAQKPTTGRVNLFGQEIDQLKRHDRPLLRRRVGVVFQDFRLLPHLSALDNVALPLRVAGVAENKIRDHVTELLKWVGLAEQVDALPFTLSGGQQQRVAIARAVITRPSLLLADEPTGNLDDAIAVRLMYLFGELNKVGTTIVVATHSERLVQQFSHRQLRIEQGHVRLIPQRSEAA
jgi:cell division transport system ATP-binding protein